MERVRANRSMLGHCDAKQTYGDKQREE